MHIGLVGGIGIAATIGYYTRLVEVFNEAEKPLELTIVHADVQTLAMNAQAGDPQAQAEVFSRHIAQLKGAGCDVATLTALTGHFCLEQLEPLSVLPLINPITLIDQYCADHAINKLGLLGSPIVLSSKLFGLLQTPETVVPEVDQDLLGASYVEMAMSGVCTDEVRQKFVSAGAAMVEDQGADAVLLAGTDLGLAFDGQDLDYAVIDALEVHVAGLLQNAM